MFESPFEYSIIKRAIDNKLIEINFVDLRIFGIGKHKLVDDKPYGGGNGMVLRVDVLEAAISKTINKKYTKTEQKIILTSAHGKTFNQKVAKSYSKLKHLIIICGHYEGFDERIKKFVDEEVSVGDFVLTGGEIPAMLIADTVARLVKNVIKDKSSEIESFSPYLEYPQFTKPQAFKKISVPKILLSGNHGEIEKWRNEESIKITQKLRPDLIKKIKKG